MNNKRLLILLFAIFTGAKVVKAQSLLVYQGNIAIAHTLTTDDSMPFQNGKSISIGPTTYDISTIDSICGQNNTMADNTVNVLYNGNQAYVTIAANVAPYLTTTVNGAHVSIAQHADLADEITYTLQGASTDGSFWMDGKLKASLVLNGLSLTCADSAAINIRNGKRISVSLADGTTNSLTDGANGSQKACFMVKGHTELKGGGTLYITGNAGHAFWGGEYVELKKSLGNIIITKAVKDGFNINQYFEMKGGTLQLAGLGDDGIQVSKTDDDTDEQNGQIIIAGGMLNINATANAAKGLKCDDAFTQTGGTINITTSGNGTYDSSSQDVAACAAIKVDGTITIDDGVVTLKSTGTGGKGINCDNNITINGGTFDIATTGKQYTYSRLSSSAKGIRAEGNLYINGGTFNITCTGGEGSEGLESKKEIHITGGDIVANTYDDAINAGTKIDISGGRIYAYATNNDGIDSNGTLYVSGGIVISTGANQPEEGFDCDQNTFSITGGTLIGLGGSTSTPTSSVTTQPVLIVGGQSLTQNDYMALNDANGNAIWTFRMPRTISQATILVSSPSLKQGSACSIVSGVSVANANEWNGFATDGTVSGGNTLISTTLSSMVTSSGATSGPGGGNRPGGGGRPGW